MQSSRRNFLRSASVAAAGAVVVAGVGTGVASAQEEESSAAAHKGSFVAWVKDPQSGQIAVLVEDREVVVTDKKLAKRLAQVAARAKRAS
jgi:nitrous oxide reductase